MTNKSTKKRKEKIKGEISAVKKSYDHIVKTYKAISKKDFDNFIKLKCNFYSRLDQEELEKYGFENGRKFEWYDVVKDFVLLVDGNYKNVNTSFEAFNFKEIYERIILILKEYMDLREDYYSLISLWIIGTWFHKDFETYPYLYLNAMKGSGKTRLLKIIAKLTPNGEVINSINEAVLFRTAFESSFCIDEFEDLENKEKRALKDLLNSAYKKGTKVKRMRKNKDEGYDVETFEVYCPLVIANISGMSDVLGDRCFELILEKSNNPKITRKVENFDENEHFSKITLQTLPLSQSVSRVSSVLTEKIRTIQKEWNNYVDAVNNNSTNSTNTIKTTNSTNSTLLKRIYKSEIMGRDLELFLPLFLIAENCGKEYLEKILEISKTITKERRETTSEENIDVKLYDFISQIENTDFFHMVFLTNKFRDFTGIEDKWLNNKWMGRAIKRLNLSSDKRLVGGRTQVRLNFTKAKEKIKMFKDVEPKEKQEKIEVVKIK